MVTSYLLLENSLSSNRTNHRNGGQTSNQGEKKCSVKESSALLWAKPLTQLALDTNVPGSLFCVTNHSKHTLSKISMWHPLYLNRAALQCPGCWAGPLLTSHGHSQTYMARDRPQDTVGGSPCHSCSSQSAPELFVSALPTIRDKLRVEKPT